MGWNIKIALAVGVGVIILIFLNHYVNLSKKSVIDDIHIQEQEKIIQKNEKDITTQIEFSNKNTQIEKEQKENYKSEKVMQDNEFMAFMIDKLNSEFIDN